MKTVLAVIGFFALLVIAALAAGAGRAVAVETGEIQGAVQSLCSVVSMACAMGMGAILATTLRRWGA